MAKASGRRPRRQRYKPEKAGGVSSNKKPDGQYAVSGSDARGETGRSEEAAVRQDRQWLFWGSVPAGGGRPPTTESKTRNRGANLFTKRGPPGRKKIIGKARFRGIWRLSRLPEENPAPPHRRAAGKRNAIHCIILLQRNLWISPPLPNQKPGLWIDHRPGLLFLGTNQSPLATSAR